MMNTLLAEKKKYSSYTRTPERIDFCTSSQAQASPSAPLSNAIDTFSLKIRVKTEAANFKAGNGNAT
jgi:hypothetical protein